MNNKTIVISVDGNIGSGKSSFIRELESKLTHIKNKQIIYLQEPVDIWATFKDKSGETLLQKFYNNKTQYAFSFQMMAYISRMTKLRQTIQKHPINCIIICERSVFTDKHVFAKMLYDDGNINDIDYEIYNTWFYEFINDVHFHGTIYLKVCPETCLKRINIRNRSGEENIPIDYLSRLEQYHNTWLTSSDTHTLTICGEKDISSYIENACENISKFV